MPWKRDESQDEAQESEDSEKGVGRISHRESKGKVKEGARIDWGFLGGMSAILSSIEKSECEKGRGCKKKPCFVAEHKSGNSAEHLR